MKSLIVTSGIANLIRENKTFRYRFGEPNGIQVRNEVDGRCLFDHWKEGRVTVEDILSKAHRPDELAKRIVNARHGIIEKEEEEKEADAH